MLKKLLFWSSDSYYFRKTSFWELIIQAVVIALSALFLLIIFSNYFQNISEKNIGFGFDFLDDTAGYHIGQSLIEYQESDSYFKVYIVGLLNTLLASFLAIVLATIFGFIVGIFLLANNWLLQRLSVLYVEVLRNIPPLLHVLFWYVVVILRVLPDYTNSISIFNIVFLNVRGLTLPEFQWNSKSWIFVIILALVILIVIRLALYSKKRKLQGKPVKVRYWILGLLGLLIILYISISPFDILLPEKGRFRFTSGFTLFPELFAIVMALATYTSTYIATIVRSSILSIPKSQIEAAQSLSLNYFQRLRYVIIPLALRSMIPPLTNQYLNITKNSSLGVAIGYPEIVAVFAGTALNQSGRAIEIMSMVLLTYLFISVCTSWLMNQYNKRVINK